MITAIVQAIQRKRIHALSTVFPMAFMGLLYFLLIVGLTYSTHPDEGIHEMGIKLSFAVFPLLAILLPAMNENQLLRYAQAFIIGCFIYMIITVVRATALSLEANDLYFMTYQSLSWYIHPTYAATYFAFALFLLYGLWRKQTLFLQSTFIHVILGALFCIFIAMLSSKAGLIAAVIAIAFIGREALRHASQRKHVLLLIAVGLMLIGLTIVWLPSSAHRITAAVKDLRSHSQQESQDTAKTISYSSTDLRKVTWSASWAVIQSTPFGTGTGATEEALHNQYELQGETYASKRRLNAHNQFLQTAAELGWPGLITLSGIIISLLLYGLRRGRLVISVFSSLCVMNFLFESFLEVQAGIVFFSFWALLFSKTNHTNSVL